MTDTLLEVGDMLLPVVNTGYNWLWATVIDVDKDTCNIAFMNSMGILKSLNGWTRVRSRWQFPAGPWTVVGAHD